MAASHLVVTKGTRCRRQAPVRLHAPEAARRGVATDAEPSDSPRPAATQRWARLGDLPASTWALRGRMAAGRACGSRGTSHGQDDTGEQSAGDRLPHGGTASRGRHRRAVVPLGARQPQAERRAARVGGEVALRTRLTPVRWVGAAGKASLFGRDDGHRPDAPGLRPISPAACQWRRRRQQSRRRSRRRRCSAPAKPATRLKLDAPITGHGRAAQWGVTRPRRCRPSQPWRPGSTGNRLGRNASGHDPALA
ncbi:hypothetical protein OFEAOIEE_LOCUS3863 [Methylorubrum extorquens]